MQPFLHPIPKKLLNDDELRPYFEALAAYLRKDTTTTNNLTSETQDINVRELYPWNQET